MGIRVNRRIRVVVPAPPGYFWIKVFGDLVDLLVGTLRDMGYVVDTWNEPIDEGRNILIAAHVLRPESWAEYFPKDTVVLNTEQIGEQGTNWTHDIMGWASGYEVWDYSDRNIAAFNGLGITARKVKLGWHKCFLPRPPPRR